MSPSVHRRVQQLSASLSERDRSIIKCISRFRLVTGSQLQVLFFADHQARLRRRSLSRLIALGALETLDRRIGGVRAGSDGLVFRLAADGKRLAADWLVTAAARVQRSGEPGERHVAHTLAIAQLYVRLHGLATSDSMEFVTEPDCWRQFATASGSRWLKPDAYLSILAGQWEHRWFVEVDLATEGVGTLTRKCNAYVDYWRTGVEQAANGAFPKVLWLTSSDRQAERIHSVVSGLLEGAQLFEVELLGSEKVLHDATEHETIDGMEKTTT